MRTSISGFNFWMSDEGGNVYLEDEGREASAGRQICLGGNFHGPTVQSDPEHFERVCRQWVRQWGQVN